MLNNLLTVADTIRAISALFDSAGLYYGHGTENAWDEASWLVLSVMGISPQLEEVDGAIPVSGQQAGRIQELAEQRIRTRKPLAYLLNSAWFCGLEFFVDERVIVPRSPIAEMITDHFSPWITGMPRRILDLCTGSACIAIACAKQFPDADVTGTDISDEALAVAGLNVERHGLRDRVLLCRADIFTGLPKARYDLIICNPPYVDADEMANLPPEFLQEPESALAAGADGLEFVRRLLQEAGNFLVPDGVLVCEVGNSEQALSRAYPCLPFIWPEFECGGSGVFVLRCGDLEELLTAPDR